jgi:hypothetical protein
VFWYRRQAAPIPLTVYFVEVIRCGRCSQAPRIRRTWADTSLQPIFELASSEVVEFPAAPAVESGVDIEVYGQGGVCRLQPVAEGTLIGAAWAHQDGKGFNLDLDMIPMRPVASSCARPSRSRRERGVKPLFFLGRATCSATVCS